MKNNRWLRNSLKIPIGIPVRMKQVTIKFLKNSHWNSGQKIADDRISYFRQAAMFKVPMNGKPNLALIKNEAQICKNSPLRLVTIMAILIMEFQVRGAKLKVSRCQKKIVEL